MSTELTKQRWPWEPVPVEDTVKALQQDMAFLVTHTAVLVRSNRVELRGVVNTPRGQIVPRGEVRFTDGTTLEFQDLGAPQPGTDTMTVDDIVKRTWQVVSQLGLEFAK